MALHSNLAPAGSEGYIGTATRSDGQAALSIPPAYMQAAGVDGIDIQITRDGYEPRHLVWTAGDSPRLEVVLTAGEELTFALHVEEGPFFDAERLIAEVDQERSFLIEAWEERDSSLFVTTHLRSGSHTILFRTTPDRGRVWSTGVLTLQDLEAVDGVFTAPLVHAYSVTGKVRGAGRDLSGVALGCAQGFGVSRLASSQILSGVPVDPRGEFVFCLDALESVTILVLGHGYVGRPQSHPGDPASAAPPTKGRAFAMGLDARPELFASFRSGPPGRACEFDPEPLISTTYRVDEPLDGERHMLFVPCSLDRRLVTLGMYSYELPIAPIDWLIYRGGSYAKFPCGRVNDSGFVTVDGLVSGMTGLAVIQDRPDRLERYDVFDPFAPSLVEAVDGFGGAIRAPRD
jgi:hypothetical protein